MRNTAADLLLVLLLAAACSWVVLSSPAGPEECWRGTTLVCAP